MSETHSCIRTTVFLLIIELHLCRYIKLLRSKHTRCAESIDAQNRGSLDAKTYHHGHLDVACRTSHWRWICATRQCTTLIHPEDMSIIARSAHFKINVRGLLSRCSNPTTRPISTPQLLRSHRSHHWSSISSPRGIATTSPATEEPFEEERLPGYEVDQFYPVSIGDTINLRYHVIGKLGYGANSTVWFCRDNSYEPNILLVRYTIGSPVI